MKSHNPVILEFTLSDQQEAVLRTVVAASDALGHDRYIVPKDMMPFLDDTLPYTDHARISAALNLLQLKLPSIPNEKRRLRRKKVKGNLEGWQLIHRDGKSTTAC